MKIPVFAYHEIARREDYQQLLEYVNKKYLVTDQLFDAQLRHLADNNYITATISDLLNKNNSKSKNRFVALTFDDGHAGNYIFAFPILKKYGMKATFYITTDLINLPRMLTWEQIREMSKEGMEIGSHSCAHKLLGLESESRVREELEQSKIIIESNIGQEIKSVSYPNGSFNARVNKIALECGYSTACISNFSFWNNNGNGFVIPRIIVDENFEVFSKILNHDPTVLLKKRAIDIIKTSIKTVAGERVYYNFYMKLFNLKEMSEQ